MIIRPEYICNYLDKVDWYQLSGNKNAIHILENNLDAKNKLKK
jgi:hypothetical protein